MKLFVQQRYAQILILKFVVLQLRKMIVSHLKHVSLLMIVLRQRMKTLVCA